MQAHTGCGSGIDFVIELAAIGEEVEVVRGGRTTTHRQLSQSSLRADENILRVHPCPNWIKIFEPVEEVCILGTGKSAGQGLVEMVMRVDQAGKDDMVL